MDAAGSVFGSNRPAKKPGAQLLSGLLFHNRMYCFSLLKWQASLRFVREPD